jgi:thymus-specific serine protease
MRILSLAILGLFLGSVLAEGWEEEEWEVAIDKTDPKVGTYSQRYFVNKDYLDRSGIPSLCVIYICGEYTCKPPLNRLYPFQAVLKLNPILYAVEHRYYGESQLFKDWSTDNLKYLTADYALDDLAAFIDEHNKQFDISFPGSKRQWMVVGGSYPGALAAWF